MLFRLVLREFKNRKTLHLDISPQHCPRTHWLNAGSTFSFEF